MLEAYANMSKLSTWAEAGRVAFRAAWNITKEEHEPPPRRSSAWQIGGSGGLTEERSGQGRFNRREKGCGHGD